MSGSSAIEWTDATWNPVTGCTRVSPGCAHCYIERTPPFRMQGRRFTHGAVGATTGVRLHPDRLEQPLHWRKPRRVFVNSLSDLFHDDVPDGFILDVFRIIADCPQHVFQVLTKRPERARDWFARWADDWMDGMRWWPVVFHNVWLGVSIENARYTWRADVLREIPAAVRFVSAEPLLGSLFDAGREGDKPTEGVPSATGDQAAPDNRATYPSRRTPLDLTGIDWVIVGGESGPGARPMHPDWARELRDACLGVCGDCLAEEDYPLQDQTHPTCGRPAFFFKQWGEWANWHAAGDYATRAADGRTAIHEWPDAMAWQVGKKRAGRELDGRTWDEFPAAFSREEEACSTSR